METIKPAIKKLKPINFNPNPIAYYVLKNGDDMGDSDYCEKCIKEQVKIAREFHIQERKRIIDQHNKILKDGYYKHKRRKIVISKQEVKNSLRSKLKYYPAKASFTYEGHDPDFGGGLQEPHTCNECGEFFLCNFQPNKYEAEYLLESVKNNEITNRMKWELYIALDNYEYSDEDSKPILEQVAKIIINKF